MRTQSTGNTSSLNLGSTGKRGRPAGKSRTQPVRPKSGIEKVADTASKIANKARTLTRRAKGAAAAWTEAFMQEPEAYSNQAERVQRSTKNKGARRKAGRPKAAKPTASATSKRAVGEKSSTRTPQLH